MVPPPHLEALGLLADLHDVLAAQLALPPLVVLQLVGELGLVLQSDELGAHLLDDAQLPHLQLLHGLVVAQQHGVLQVLLRLTFVQLLRGHAVMDQGRGGRRGREEGTVREKERDGRR